MSIILSEAGNKQEISNSISRFIRDLKVGSLLNKCNCKKEKGIPFMKLFTYILCNVFCDRSMYMQKKTGSFKEDFPRMRYGCDCYVPLDDISVKEKGNAIIIGGTTSTIYYQENDFITGDHIVVCRAKWINKYTALFIKSLIEKERYKYNYGRAFKMDLIKKTKIYLPAININGEFVPDWNFMQNYINSLPYGDKI